MNALFSNSRPDRPTPRNATSVDAHLGARLRLRRQAAGLSQGGLGEALGVTFQQIQKYENGRNRISASRLYDAARVLKTGVDFFFHGLPDPVSFPLIDDRPVCADLADPLAAFAGADARTARAALALLDMPTAQRTSLINAIEAVNSALALAPGATPQDGKG